MAIKEKKEWNRNQTGMNLRKSIFNDEIDAVLGSRDGVTLKNVQEAGDKQTQPRMSPVLNELLYFVLVCFTICYRFVTSLYKFSSYSIRSFVFYAVFAAGGGHFYVSFFY